MRIISKFHDYYDGAMALGQDQTVVYERTPLEYRVDNKPPEQIIKLSDEIIRACYPNTTSRFLFNRNYFQTRGKLNWYISSEFIIIFCGTLYKGLRISATPDNVGSTQYHYCYDAESVVELLAKDGAKLEENDKYRYRMSQAEYVKKYFENQIPINKEFLIENKIAVAVMYSEYGAKVIEINPCLKEYEFYKVFDSYSCYQELDMYISGVLSYPHNFTVDIEDKYKIIEHGFDPKYGFRTRPHD